MSNQCLKKKQKKKENKKNDPVINTVTVTMRPSRAQEPRFPLQNELLPL